LIKLNNLNLKNIAEELLDTFLEAGKIAKEISRRGVKITIKADKSPVTDGDLAVDQLLKDKIANLTPDIPIISEETVSIGIKNQNKTFWLIDPIDGTRDYIKKKDEYTLNAALIINLKPAVGIIYAPEKDRLFFSYGKYLAFEINNRKIIIYFLIFGPTKNAVITVPISIKKATFILHISASGYSPYINRLIQKLIKSQHAPSPVHSSLVVPIKLASKNSQFKRPGIVLINTKITNKDKIALNQFEFIFLFN